MQSRTLLAAAAALVLASACSAPTTTPEAVTASPAASQAASSEPAPASSDPADPRCQKIIKDFAQAILDGGNDNKLGYVTGAAVESDENPGNYFVAIRFTIDGDKDNPEVGVWQSLNLKSGPFRSVDGFAKQFTVWPDSGNNGAEIVDVARSCLG